MVEEHNSLNVSGVLDLVAPSLRDSAPCCYKTSVNQGQAGVRDPPTDCYKPNVHSLVLHTLLSGWKVMCAYYSVTDWKKNINHWKHCVTAQVVSHWLLITEAKVHVQVIIDWIVVDRTVIQYCPVDIFPSLLYIHLCVLSGKWTLRHISGSVSQRRSSPHHNTGNKTQ